MKFAKKTPIFSIRSWRVWDVFVHEAVWVFLVACLVVLANISPYWIFLSSIFALTTYLLDAWKHGLDGDIRIIVLTRKVVETKKGEHVIKHVVDDKVKHQVRIDGRWFDIVEKKRRKK